MNSFIFIFLGREKQMEVYADDKIDVNIANARGRSLSLSSAVRGNQLSSFRAN